jgi:isopenicillin N synthase-like dioxygenase
MVQYNRNGKKKKDLMEAYNWGYNPKFDPEVAIADQEEPDVDYVKLLWPRELPGFKETLYQHHSQLLTLARRLTKTFALALHLDEDHFAEYIKHPAAAMRITHYPPQEVRIHGEHHFDHLADDNIGFTFGPIGNWRAY